MTNRESLDMVRFPDCSDADVIGGAPGAFCWMVPGPARVGTYRHLCMRLPGGSVGVVPVEGPHAWIWDGDEDRPTLSPSVLQRDHDGVELWHGFIRAGRMESC